MSKLTHLGEDGSAHMVDVSAKGASERSATAEARVSMSAEALAALREGQAKKGDVLGAARIAGIMAAKRTADLIPLCHPLPITHASVEAEEEEGAIRIRATVKTVGVTGVEMEALTAATVAALTVYDMLKAVDRHMTIGDVRLLEKTGGGSGVVEAPPRLRVAQAPRRASRARELMHETGAVRVAALPTSDARRDAFRRFMSERRLQATVWARKANVPVALIYSFLHGRTRELDASAAEKLAAAEGVSLRELFGDRG